MKNIVLLIIISIACSCNNKNNREGNLRIDNEELIQIYKADQEDRQKHPIDWDIVSKRDSIRELRVYQLLESNKVKTSRDYQNAAMIFQHGGDSIAYGMAVKLMRKSIELDSTVNKWLLAAAIDRYLLSKNEPQIYGTQYLKNGENEPWRLGKIDTTKISDKERIEYGVETIAQQRETVLQMNRKKLFELYSEGVAIDSIILIILETINEPDYDISENGINTFGYRLMNQNKTEDALKILKLNTKLYPEGFNTFDSYGECLLKLGEKEKAIIAYKKSLELNPQNENAIKILMSLQ